jgi:hypothetical protein
MRQGPSGSPPPGPIDSTWNETQCGADVVSVCPPEGAGVDAGGAVDGVDPASGAFVVVPDSVFDEAQLATPNASVPPTNMSITQALNPFMVLGLLRRAFD